MNKLIAITGADGFIGGQLVKKLPNTRPLSRNGAYQFELGKKPNPDILAGVDLLVHCAYDFKKPEVNVRGTKSLLSLAKQKGVKTIVISSMAIQQGNKSIYARNKRGIEQIAKRAGATIIRPGIVFGEENGGVMQVLERVARTPIIPYAGNQHLYFCHIDDLVTAVQKLANSRRKLLVACEQSGYTFPDVMTILAGKKRICIRVPFRLLYTITKILESAGLKIRSDSLRSLFDSPSIQEIKRTPGFTFRSFSQFARTKAN